LKHLRIGVELGSPQIENIVIFEFSVRAKKAGLPYSDSPFVKEFQGRGSMCGEVAWTPITLLVMNAVGNDL
jgi:hypothetical protein